MGSIARVWKGSPAVRFVVRSVVVASAAYLVAALQAGEALDWTSLAVAAATAGLTSIVGLLTPVEPFVGPSFAKPENVEVPVPPAEPAK